MPLQAGSGQVGSQASRYLALPAFGTTRTEEPVLQAASGMPKNQTSWKPGQSGNPKGRPPKSRALTDLLEKAGSTTRADVDGVKRNRKRILARMLWEFVTTGQAAFPDGQVVKADDSDDWLAAVRFLYSQIDGPPPKEIDLQGDLDLGGGLIINIGDESDGPDL
jgi:hypothetical protein